MFANKYNFHRLGEKRYLKENIYRSSQKRENWRIFELIKEANPHLFVDISEDFQNISITPKPRKTSLKNVSR